MWQGNWQQSQNSLLMSTILALHAPIQLRRLCHPESPNDAQSALSPLGGFLCPGLSHRPELCQKDQKQKRESHEASIHRGLSLALALQGCASYAGSFVTSVSSDGNGGLNVESCMVRLERFTKNVSNADCASEHIQLRGRHEQQ